MNIQWNIEIKLKKNQYFLESSDQNLKIRCKNTIIGFNDAKIRCGDSYLEYICQYNFPIIWTHLNINFLIKEKTERFFLFCFVEN